MDIDDTIRQVALNYIEGWYTGDLARMKTALHPKLVKRRFLSNNDIWKIDTPWMLDATKAGKGKLIDPQDGKIEIIILDIFKNIAAVKIISVKFIDYLHMVKIEGEWKIADVLWDYKVKRE